MNESVVKFVEDLEPRRRGRNLDRVRALAARPGVWAEFYVAGHKSGGVQVANWLKMTGIQVGVEIETFSRQEERGGVKVRVHYGRALGALGEKPKP